jgi:hypothetical protein
MSLKNELSHSSPEGKSLLSFAINDYQGNEHDLNGCINDQADIVALIRKNYPSEFIVKMFRDSDVTVNCFKSEVTEEIKAHPGVPVVFISDSCFSESNTRSIMDHKARFLKNPDALNSPERRNRLFLNENQIGFWIAISGCKEHQTSADAVFNNRFNGACTFALVKAFDKSLTYRQWVEKANEILKAKKFKQVMTIEGPEELVDRIVFADPCILIHYSGHGTYTTDLDGDEKDKYDEALYLYDGLLVDDDMNHILSTIKN